MVQQIVDAQPHEIPIAFTDESQVQRLTDRRADIAVAPIETHHDARIDPAPNIQDPHKQGAIAGESGSFWQHGTCPLNR